MRRAAVLAATATSATTSAGGNPNKRRVGPLPVMPTFHPQPFKHDKFLAIKGRSAETLIEASRDIRARCRRLQDQVHALRGDERSRSAPSIAEAGADTNAAIAASSSTSIATQPLLYTERLPAALVDEQAALCLKIDRLSSMQGFVLPDELVYMAWHTSVVSGALSVALREWLLGRILGEDRGPVYPSFLLEDLVAIAEGYLTVAMPEGGADLLLLSALPTSYTTNAGVGCNLNVAFFAARSLLQAAASTAAAADCDAATVSSPATDEDRHLVMQELCSGLWSVETTSSYPLPSWRSPASSLEWLGINHNPYVRYQLKEIGIPLIAGADGLGLLFQDATPRALEEMEEAKSASEDPGGGEHACSGDQVSTAVDGNAETAWQDLWLPRPEIQRCAVRRVLRGFTSAHSFSIAESLKTSSANRIEGASAAEVQPASPVLSLSSLSLTASQSSPSMLPDARGVRDGVATLRSLVRLYTALAQCAAEAREPQLLLALFAAVCRGFLTTAATTTPAPATRDTASVRLNIEVWVAGLNGASAAPATTINSSSSNTLASTVRDMLERFFVDFTATVFYGRQLVVSDQTLWRTHDTLQLVAATRTVLGVDASIDEMQIEMSHASGQLRRQAAALRTVRMNMTSEGCGSSTTVTAAGVSTAAAQRLLDETLPAALRTVLSHTPVCVGGEGSGSKRGRAVEAAGCVLWAEAAALARSALADVITQRRLQQQQQNEECVALMNAAVHAAKLVAVAESDAASLVAQLAQQPQGSSSSSDVRDGGVAASAVELSAAVATVVARQQAAAHTAALLQRFYGEGTATGTSSSHSLPTNTDSSPDNWRAMLSAVAPVQGGNSSVEAREARVMIVEAALDALTADLLTAAVCDVSRCYDAAASTSIVTNATTATAKVTPPGAANTMVSDVMDCPGEDDGDAVAMVGIEDTDEMNAAAAEGYMDDAVYDQENEITDSTSGGGDVDAGARSQSTGTAAASGGGVAAGSTMTVDVCKFMAVLKEASGETLLDRVCADVEAFVATVLPSPHQNEPGPSPSSSLSPPPLTAAAVAQLAVLYSTVGPRGSARVYAQLTDAATALLTLRQQIQQRLQSPSIRNGSANDGCVIVGTAAGPDLSNDVGVGDTGGFGNANGVLLVVLARRSHWSLAYRLLNALVSVSDSSALSSVTIEASMFHEVFQRARDAGATEVCLLLRANRERLFY